MVAEKLCCGCQGMSTPVRIKSSGLVLNEWKGYCRHHPVRDCCWYRRGENHGRFGGRFTRYHVSLVFSSYRDGLQRDGEFGDQIQGKSLDVCRVNPTDTAFA
jgi:hypothetical protein